MIKTLYAVVDKDGDFVRNSARGGGAFRIYSTRASAERWAVWEGDAVVEMDWDTDRQPLYIRAKTVRPG